MQARGRALAAPAAGDAAHGLCPQRVLGVPALVRAGRARDAQARASPQCAHHCIAAPQTRSRARVRARPAPVAGRALCAAGCCVLTGARRLPPPPRAPPADAPAARAGGAEPAATERVGPAHLALQPVAGRQRGGDVHRGAQRSAPAPRGRPVGHAGLWLVEGPAAALGAAQAARVAT